MHSPKGGMPQAYANARTLAPWINYWCGLNGTKIRGWIAGFEPAANR